MCMVVCGRRRRTIVLEADRIGAGSTAASLGLIREDFDASFQDTAARHGLRAAQNALAGTAPGVARLCGRHPAPRYPLRSRCRRICCTSFAGTPDAVKRLRREYDARRAAGFDHIVDDRGRAVA